MNADAEFLTDRAAARPTAWDEINLPFPTAAMKLVVATDGTALVGIAFVLPDEPSPSPAGVERDREHPVLVEATAQLTAYALGDRHRFDLPLRLTGTPFQLAVWAALRDIPYGETSTYGKVAAGIGRPTSTRAVGAAIGANPIGIVVPCHRVIGASGALTGFGGGLQNKATLLAREGFRGR